VTTDARRYGPLSSISASRIRSAHPLRSHSSSGISRRSQSGWIAFSQTKSVPVVNLVQCLAAVRPRIVLLTARRSCAVNASGRLSREATQESYEPEPTALTAVTKKRAAFSSAYRTALPFGRWISQCGPHSASYRVTSTPPLGV
jgi:hypothetical protein